MKINEKNLINVSVADTIFTPFTCATVINEIIKNLIYQKSQIPYSYSWLEAAVKRKRSARNEELGVPNLRVDSYYKHASTAYDNLQEIMEHIQNEFLINKNSIKEVIILFGSTPSFAKELFIIKIPTINKIHLDKENFSPTFPRDHQKVLREIFMSNGWLEAMQTTLPHTNTYFMLKKAKDVEISNSDFFIYQQNYKVPCSSKCYTINFNINESCLSSFNSSTSDNTCCNVVPSELNVNHLEKYSSNEQFHWFQASKNLKGFRDLFIDKISASNLW